MRNLYFLALAGVLITHLSFATYTGNPTHISTGGTAATGAAAAINNLLPSQSGNGGFVLGTSGSSPAWQAAVTGPTGTFAQLNGTNVPSAVELIQPGYAQFLTNPGFENGTTGWTASTGTFTTQATTLFAGAASAKWVVASSGATLSQDFTPPVALTNTQITVGCWVYTLNGNGCLSARLAGAATGSCLTIQDAGGWTFLTTQILAPSSGSFGVEIKTTTSGSFTGYMDQCYVGPAGAVEHTRPAGEVIMFVGATCPPGTIAANGTGFSQASYPQLAAAVGSTYAAAAGSTYYPPDYRGMFLRGSGTNGLTAGSGANGTAYAGAALGTVQTDMIQGHYHGVTVGGFPIMDGLSGSTSGYYVTNTNNLGNGTNAIANAATTDSTNGTPRTGFETRPGNLSVNYCIVAY